VLAALDSLLVAHRPAFTQRRTYDRLVTLVFGCLVAFARHTLAQLLLVLGQGDQDWSATYRLFSRERLDYERLGHCFLGEYLQTVPATGPFVVAVDGLKLRRSSRRMEGTAWDKAPGTAPFRPGICRMQRYSHLAGLLPQEAGYSRAVPLRLAPAFPPKAVFRGAPTPKTEWEAGLDQLDWLRGELDQAGRTEQEVLAVTDATYDVCALWTSLPQRVLLLTRTKRNRVLYALPQRRPGPGVPAKYGERAPTPGAWLRGRERPWKQVTVCVRGRERTQRVQVQGPYLRDGMPDLPLFLIVVGGTDRVVRGRRVRTDPAFYLIQARQTERGWALPLPLETLLSWAWQRWEVEVCHRESKAGFGVGEMQSWADGATIRTARWQLWTYAVLVLAAYRTWGLTGQPSRPVSRWWPGAQRWSFNTLWRTYRAELWGRAEFWAGCARTPHNLPPILPGGASLGAAVAHSLRA
jgi:hypothetical protein